MVSLMHMKMTQQHAEDIIKVIFGHIYTFRMGLAGGCDGGGARPLDALHQSGRELQRAGSARPDVPRPGHHQIRPSGIPRRRA